MNNKNLNISLKDLSNSSRKIVKASKDSVMKNHSRSYRRYEGSVRRK